MVKRREEGEREKGPPAPPFSLLFYCRILTEEGPSIDPDSITLPLWLAGFRPPKHRNIADQRKSRGRVSIVAEAWFACVLWAIRVLSVLNPLELQCTPDPLSCAISVA